MLREIVVEPSGRLSRKALYGVTGVGEFSGRNGLVRTEPRFHFPLGDVELSPPRPPLLYRLIFIPQGPPEKGREAAGGFGETEGLRPRHVVRAGMCGRV